jgi:hypothetical protein
MIKRGHTTMLRALIAVVVLAIAGNASATDIKTLGRLKIPAHASILPVCTDPVVQSVLNEDLRGRPRSGAPVIVTVTINARPLAPGVSIQDLSPGDPSVVDMLKDMGAQPPSLGDTGDKPLEDPYTTQARQETLTHMDPMTEQFRSYVARRSDAANASPYNDIPPNQLYQTAIVARASVSDSSSEFKVVALVAPGDDVRAAKKLVAEEIANAILH